MQSSGEHGFGSTTLEISDGFEYSCVKDCAPRHDHATDDDLYFAGGGPGERRRKNIRMMLDSITHMGDVERIRNFAMSE